MLSVCIVTTAVFVDINVWSEVLPDNRETLPTGCLERAPPSDLTLSPGAGISGPISVEEKSPAMHRSVAEVSRVTVAV